MLTTIYIGVMDIKHLLCQPCDPYSSSFSSSNKLEGYNSSNDLLHLSQHSYYPNEEEQQIRLWRGGHNRSNSTLSISSCSSSSDKSSIVSQQHQSPISSVFSSPTHSPILQNQQRQGQHYYPQHPPQQSVHSNRRTISTTSHTYHYQQQTTQRRSRSKSSASSYIQTRTPWTPEEDELLQKGYEQGLSWAMISCTYLPYRSRGCCWGRFKTLRSKNVIEVYQQRICQRPWKITAGGSTTCSSGSKKKKQLFY